MTHKNLLRVSNAKPFITTTNTLILFEQLIERNQLKHFRLKKLHQTRLHRRTNTF